jgi:hypothetical protein
MVRSIAAVNRNIKIPQHVDLTGKIPNSRTRSRPRLSSRMSMVSPSTTRNTSAVAAIGLASAAGVDTNSAADVAISVAPIAKTAGYYSQRL